MKIYTKTGDRGQTGLIGGAKVSKTDTRIAAIGDVDELNACLGLCRAIAPEDMQEIFAKLQNWLFDLGAELASPDEHARQHRALTAQHVEYLESSIDEQTTRLSPLENFILPGGIELAARIHLARCVCRRAERTVLEVNNVSGEAKIFLNRLSDWLFTAARTANHSANVSDVVWEKSGI